MMLVGQVRWDLLKLAEKNVFMQKLCFLQVSTSGLFTMLEYMDCRLLLI